MIVRNPPVLPPITCLWLCIILYALTAACAYAGELKLVLRDASGKPVKDAAVSFTPDQGADISLDLKQKTYVMAQQGMNFAPHVLVVPKGASVQFPNRDTVSHHVYSFSPVHNFQLPLYGPRVTRAERFDKLGTVALGCNIHDSMSAYIRVVDTPYFAVSDATGVIVLSNLPETKGRLDIWHPLQTMPDNLMSKSLTPTAAVTLSLTLKLRRLAKVSEAY